MHALLAYMQPPSKSGNEMPLLQTLIPSLKNSLYYESPFFLYSKYQFVSSFSKLNVLSPSLQEGKVLKTSLDVAFPYLHVNSSLFNLSDT
jgi:hypothetical protein